MNPPSATARLAEQTAPGVEFETASWQGKIAASSLKGEGLDTLRAALQWVKGLGADVQPKVADEIMQAAYRHAGDHGSEVTLDAIYFSIFPAAEGQNETLDEIATSADFETEISRLAVLKPFDYERRRKAAAEQLGVRAIALDHLVKAERNKASGKAGQGQQLELASPEPWPEEVAGSVILAAMSDELRSYVVMSPAQADAVALWCLHTHCFERFSITPRLAITSVEKGCGKTTLLDVTRELVPRAIECANVSVAAVFRVIELARPTLLIDEADTFLNDNDELRGILNSGHRNGGAVMRIVGDDHEPRKFAVFAPVAIAKIGQLPDTLHDRSIIVELRRRTKREPVERFRHDRVASLLRLTRQAARWAADNADKLVDSDPEMGDLFNRTADNWRPLFAIADFVGGEWPARARAAAEAAKVGHAEDSLKVALLEDIRELCLTARATVDTITSDELASSLIALEGHPWAEFGKHGKPITKAKLANLLRGFTTDDGRPIAPSDLWMGGRSVKGYRLRDFADAFERYLPEPASRPRDRESADGTTTFADFRPRGGGAASHPENSTNAVSTGILAPSRFESPFGEE